MSRTPRRSRFLVSGADVRDLWRTTARLREAAGDKEGAAQARLNAKLLMPIRYAKPEDLYWGERSELQREATDQG